MSIRWRILLVTMVVVFIPIAFLSHYAIRFFDQFTRRALEQEMIHTAFAAGEVFRDYVDQGDSCLLTGWLDRMAGHTESRIRLFLPDGTLLHDSANLDDYRETPPSEWEELQHALGGTYKARFKLTPDRKYIFYYCAQPVLEGDQVLAVAHVSRHTNAIIKAIGSLRDDQWLATWIALALAAVVSAILAQTLTWPLRRLTRAARACTRGEPFPEMQWRGGGEINELGEAFATMTRALQRRNQYNRDFMHDTLHELSAPVSAIQGAVEILQEGGGHSPEVRARFLQNIREQGDRLHRLVGELNELALLDNEDQDSSRQQTDLGTFLPEVLNRFTTTYPEADLPTISLEAGPQALPVFCHPWRLEQVFQNLLENAVRHTPADGRIQVRAERSGDLVLIDVVDSGCGIPPENRARIFERFFTTSRQRGVTSTHSGLGLTIVRGILEKVGGSIQLLDLPEGSLGTGFRIKLPAL